MALPLVLLLPLLDSGTASDPVPAENDVVAGGTAMLVFGFLVVLLLRSETARVQGRVRPLSIDAIVIAVGIVVLVVACARPVLG